MARRFFRKLMPREEKLRASPMLRVFGSTLFHRRLWHLNRHSTALGVACGVGWAWIALPIQTVGAVATAFFGKGNVPLAMAFTWISNPVTWVPCFLLAYEVGLLLTGAERMSGFREQIQEVMSAGIIDGIWVTGRFLTANLLRLYPMYIGGVALGLITGGTSYGVVTMSWRWNVARRWQRRHHERRENGHGPMTRRLSRGFGSLARLRSHARA